MFSKQHYKAVANIIALTARDGTREFLTQEFIWLFEKDNPLFDKEKFSKACGLD